MSRLLKLSEDIASTQALVARYTGLLAETKDASVAFGLKSLTRQLSGLEASYAEEANSLGRDVCRYRLFGESNPSIYGIGTALANFQHAFSVIFSALKHGPKDRARVSADIRHETELDFGYAFA